MKNSEGEGPFFDLVAIAASAGGLYAISTVLGALPADLPAAVVVVQHLDPKHPSLLSEILARRTSLPVKQADTHDRAVRGQVLVAPPNRNLILQDGGHVLLQLTGHGPHIPTPSADLFFESAARCFRERCIAVILTGTGTDGSSGLVLVRQTGGKVIAQDAASSQFSGMPVAAAKTGCVDWVLPLGAIGPAIIQLVHKGTIP